MCLVSCYDECMKMFGNIDNQKENCAMPRCACVTCNSCTCACSCRNCPNDENEMRIE